MQFYVVVIACWTEQAKADSKSRLIWVQQLRWPSSRSLNSSLTVSIICGTRRLTHFSYTPRSEFVGRFVDPHQLHQQSRMAFHQKRRNERDFRHFSSNINVWSSPRTNDRSTHNIVDSRSPHQFTEILENIQSIPNVTQSQRTNCQCRHSNKTIKWWDLCRNG